MEAQGGSLAQSFEDGESIPDSASDDGLEQKRRRVYTIEEISTHVSSSAWDSPEEDQDTLDDVSSLQEEAWDPNLISNSTSPEEEASDATGTQTRKQSSLEECQEILDKICRLASPPSLGLSQVVRRLPVVARKNLELVTYRLLELPWSTCGELLWAVVTSPYCSGDGVLSLLLDKEKEGPWLPQGGEEQTSHPLPAATARATRLIGRIVRSEECPVVLEAWFPELLLCLVDTIMTGARQQNIPTEGGDHLPPEETVEIIQVLLARVAHLPLEETCREMLCRPSCCLQGVAVLVMALTETSPSATCALRRHLSSVLEKEEAKEHSAAAVAFFVELLANDKSQVPVEKTWKLLMAWLEHPSQTICQLSRKGLLHLCKNYKVMMSPEELCHAVLGGLCSDSSAITLEFLGLAEQLGLQAGEDVWSPLNASLAAQYRSLFHHEAATIRQAALKHIWPLLQHRKDLEGRAAIHTLIAVLMHVEDAEEEVAKAAKVTLRHLAQALRWHLGGTLLAGGTYSLQELLHRIAKLLIRFPISEGQLEMEVFACLSHFKSKQASVRRTAAMFIGHLLHRNGSLLTGGPLPVYLAYLEMLLGDQDPAVRRVAQRTEALVRKAFSLHAPHGLVAALRRLAAGCRRQRYPPEYDGLSA